MKYYNNDVKKMSAFLLLARGLGVIASLSLLFFASCELGDCDGDSDSYSIYEQTDQNFLDCVYRQYGNKAITVNSGEVDVEYVKEIAKFIAVDVKYVRDSGDYWQTAHETIDRMAGDCEDKALYAYFMFREKGFDDKKIGLTLLLTDKLNPSSLHVAATVEIDDEQFVLTSGKIVPTTEYIGTEKEVIMEFNVLDYI